MKPLCSFLLLILLLFAQLPAYSNSCGNNSSHGAQSCKCSTCDSLKSGDPFNPYTGNERREVRDLEVWGGVGQIPLRWIRYYNSRESEGWWRFSFQYHMFESTNDQGQPIMTIQFPAGEQSFFIQTAAATWMPTVAIENRLFQQGNNFFLQMPNGHRYRFEKLSTAGGTIYQLQDIRDNFQNLYTLSYNADHNLSRITEPGGRYLAITYSTLHGFSVITRVSTSDNRHVDYHYTFETNGVVNWLLLTSVDYGDGTQATYSYYPYSTTTNGVGQVFRLLEHAVDPRYEGTNVNMRFTYDMNIANGYIKEERNGKTGELMVTLNTSEGNRWVCYANGRVQHLIMPEEMQGRMQEYIDGLGRSTRLTYDSRGFVETMTDALGRTTSFVKTMYDNPLKITYPDGSYEEWTRDELDQVLTYRDELGRVTTYTRDNRHRVTRIKYPDGTIERFTYNSYAQVLTHTLRNGGVESYTYDSRGLKTSFSDALGNITRYTYDGADRLASKTDARGNTTRQEYNERGLLTKLINADNSFQTFTYDDYGNRTSITNELGNTWSMLYDEFKRLISKKDPLNREIQYKYDLPGGGCGCSHDNGSPTKIILPSGKVTAITYDVEWQKTAETVGAGTPDAATTFYEYDEEGRLVTVVDPQSKSTVYEYDVRNRLVSSTDPLGHKTERTYDAAGNTVQQKRADNSTTVNVYDDMNRLLQSTDAKGGTTKMLYDEEGNLVRLTDANSRNYNFEYDLLNRRTMMDYPGASSERYTYDGVGNMTSYANRAGDVRTYTYDNRNRETASNWSDNTPDITHSYDAASRLLTLSSNVSLLTYTYNAANELTSETQAIAGAGGGARTVSYSYNADGLPATLSYPGNSTVVNYTYTGRNQVKTIIGGGMSNVAATYSYDLNGNRIEMNYGNGTSTAYAYDSDNSMLKVDNQKGEVSFARYDYGYDAVHRRTYVKRDNAKGDVYAYDATDQLTGVQYEVTNPEGGGSSPVRTVTYDWDAVGNRNMVTDNGTATNYTFNNRNQYTSIGGNLVNYNANGALRTFDGWTYAYDAQNRLTRAEKGGTLVRFAYDARNRRVRQVVNGDVTYLYYNGWNLIQENNNTGSTTAEYVHGARIDEILTKAASAAGAVFYHYDALGSVTHLTNTTGNVMEQYSYDVFGAVSMKDGNGNLIAASAFGNRFLFTGRELIQEIELYDYRNRMYAAQLGRFLQTDPMRFDAGDVNLYRYVQNNPVNLTDPLGEFWCTCCTTACVIAVTAAIAGGIVLSGGTLAVTFTVGAATGIVAVGAGVLIGTACYNACVAIGWCP